LRVVRSESGASSLELAFIATLLFLFISGITDLGGAYQHYIVTINASREGARMYSRLPCNSGNRSAVRNAVINAAVGEATNSRVTLLADNIERSPDPGSTCPESGAAVEVTVLDNYTPLMGTFWGETTFPIRASTSMMFYGN
jgi:Flp pilus assembly protein TadG